MIMKKLLLALSGVVLSITAFSRDFRYSFEGRTLYYTVLDETEKTCKTKDGTSGSYGSPGNQAAGNLVIPDIAKDGNQAYTVIALGESAFRNCDNLNSVFIPGSVKEIGGDAFSGCRNLKEVNTPSISAWLKIKFVSQYSNPLFIAEKMLIGGNTINNLTIPEGTDTIHEYAFYNNKSLTSVSFPDDIKYVGDNAFSECNQLQKFEFNSLKAFLGIGYQSEKAKLTFDNYGKIYISGEPYETPEELVWPEDLKYIPANAFCGDRNLKRVILSDGIEYIGENAFLGSPLEFIGVPENSERNISTIPGNIKSIQPRTFAATKITSIKIPDSVTKIDDNAFINCLNLSSVTIPNSVDSIGEFAFQNCPKLASINIPKSVTKVSRYAFSMTGITSVVIPASISCIPEGLFWKCAELKNITIPNSVKSIGNFAFKDCINLTSITIPNSVTSIGKDVFWNCPKLSTLNMSLELKKQLEENSRVMAKMPYSISKDRGDLYWTTSPQGVKKLVTKSGKVILTDKYDSIYFMSDAIIVEKNGKYGAVSYGGKVLAAPIYAKFEGSGIEGRLAFSNKTQTGVKVFIITQKGVVMASRVFTNSQLYSLVNWMRNNMKFVYNADWSSPAK